VASCSDLQNETGLCEEKWHKTDTSGSASVRAGTGKENAVPAGPRNGINSKQKTKFSDTIVSTIVHNVEAESDACLSIPSKIALLDRAVLSALSRPDGQRRNGKYCFSRRSHIAREVGVRRDILNASIRRLTQAGTLSPVYSTVLARWGVEILDSSPVIAERGA
jgi:hypothetical protein